MLLPPLPQASRPPWLPKPGMLDLGGLRAYGTTQLHRLAVALRARSLPLGQPTVGTLLQQVVYHVGELTDAAVPSRLWRMGWDEQGGGVLHALRHELGSLAEELRDKPREQEAVGVLGEVGLVINCCSIVG